MFSLIFCVPAVAQTSTVSDDSTKAVTGLLPLPIIYYTPETGLAIGGAGMYFVRPPLQGAKPSVFTGVAVYTAKRQFTAEFSCDVYLENEKYRVAGVVSGTRYPHVFFGIGNNTAEARQEKYTSTSYRISADALRRLTEHTRAGFSFYAEERTVGNTDPSGLLASGLVPGSRGGRTVAVGVAASWDSREHLFWPTSGMFHQLQLRYALPSLGSSTAFSRTVADARIYRQVGRDIVVALQASSIITTGDVPFHKLAELGGQNLMRGYFQGRFSDKVMCAIQAETRFHVWGPIGGVVFAGVGDVAASVSRFSAGSLKPSAGVGIRYAFSPAEKLNLRIDYGVGRESSGMYFTANEAF